MLFPFLGKESFDFLLFLMGEHQFIPLERVCFIFYSGDVVGHLLLHLCNSSVNSLGGHMGI